MPEYTREYLIDLCERAIVPHDKWRNRDSPHAQERVGTLWALLKACCDFSIRTEANYQGVARCFTDERTIWLEIHHKTFGSFDAGEDWEWEAFYLPTEARLAEVDGRDWY